MRCSHCGRLWFVQIPSAGALVFDSARRILLIRRGREPSAGRWSVPGGKCLPDEPTDSCCVRETLEETGLIVQIVRLAGRVTLPAPGGDSFVVDDYECTVVGSAADPTPADDAADAGWFTQADLDDLDLVDGLREALTRWNLLPH